MQKPGLRSFVFVLSLLFLSYQISGQVKRPARSDSFFGIHFDLHAGENITDAGRTLTFEMIDTFLLRVKPDFIQIDCKGHPGISSYPTEVGFHVKGFDKDPLKLFREVTAKNNVALYMHFSGIWDDKVVQQHPDWAVVKANGARSGQKVSFFSPYSETYMIPQLKELSSRYDVDGAWIDGECWAVEPDYGEASLSRFTLETGITEIPRERSDRYYPEFMEYTRALFREHLNKYINAIHLYNPGFQITSNWAYSSLMPEKVNTEVDYLSGDVTPQNGVYRSAYEARCLAPQGKPWDLMAWGFSWNGGDMPMSIKSAAQLKQEAAQIIAMGGGVQFYFQQNRDLSIKPWLAYMLQEIARFCRERQQFCHKAIPVPQVALIYPSVSYQEKSPVPYSGPTGRLQGALYALLDAQYPVEILMEHHLPGKLDEYSLVVVPECQFLSEASLEEIRSYLKNGGRVLVIGSETAGIFREELGIKSSEIIKRTGTFISIPGRIGSVKSEVLKVMLQGDARPLSFFYTASDFSYKGDAVSASINRYGNGRIAGIYFNAGTSYIEYKTPVIKDFIEGVISELNPGKIVEVAGSDLVHVAVNKLNNRIYVNLINVAGEHTAQSVIGYDEIPPLQDLRVTINLSSKPAAIILQPEGKKLRFSYKEGRAAVAIPGLTIHSILEVY